MSLPLVSMGSVIQYSPATNLRRICYTISTDPGRVRGTVLARADLGEICHRAVSTTDLSELRCKSHDLPDSLIPALPSYGLTGLPASCAFSPMTLQKLSFGRNPYLVASPSTYTHIL
ncbi:uncharacterized protein UDID_17850 [Ustilago sp. UG-2017a]|nr:uncharacterized protein UDID_17850 [Ustilago sp. UG-2017a]